MGAASFRPHSDQIAELTRGLQLPLPEVSSVHLDVITEAFFKRSPIFVRNLRYRREHVRVFAPRVEVADDAIRIMGSKNTALRTLVAAKVGKSAGTGVPGFVPKWRAAPDPDEHYVYAIAL